MKWISRSTASRYAYLLGLIVISLTATTVAKPVFATELETASTKQPAVERLQGTWLVDFSKTMNFSAKNIKTTPSYLDIFACSINDTTLTFTAQVMELAVASHVCKHKERSGAIEGFTSKFPYSVIYDEQAQTVLILVGESEQVVKVVNWTAADQFWVDEASESEVTRYFFKRK